MATVYMLTNRLNGKSYVGVSETTTAARWKKHKAAARTVPSRRTVVQKAIAKYGVDAFEVITLIEGSVGYCYFMEEKVIAAYNTQAEGYNRHQGGVGGFSNHPESLEKARNTWASADYKEKKRDAAVALAKDAEYLRRVGAGVKAAFARPEVKERHRSAVVAALSTTEYREKQSKIQSVSQKNPDTNVKRAESLRGFYATPEGKAKRSEQMKSVWKDKEKNAARIAKMVATKAAKKAAIIAAAMVVSACGSSNPFIKTEYVSVPVPVSCVTWEPARENSAFAGLGDDSPLWEQVRALLVDRERDAHFIEGQQAVINGCKD